MTLPLVIMTSITLVSATMFMMNFVCFRRVSKQLPGGEPTGVSILIPARDEGDRIAATLEHVLASQQVNLEVIVLDDQSQDETASIVERLASSDTRLKLIHGEKLPAGWCGKQFACLQLAEAANHEELVFLDADVHLDPMALACAVATRRTRKLDLLSGFPRQRTESWGEALLIPMIYLVLLTYLPFLLMRFTRMPAASAGCGQWFLTTRKAYQHTGGHRRVRSSLHDGVMLPRAYRKSGCSTDVFDASPVASCRMYVGWSETWRGLHKNATEGIANARLIAPFSVLLTGAYLLPMPALLAATLWPAAFALDHRSWFALVLAGIASATPVAILAFRRLVPLRFLVAFPLGVGLFLLIQWQALWRSVFGVQSSWRGRSYAPEQSHG